MPLAVTKPSVVRVDCAPETHGYPPQAQRPGARDATIATATLPPGSLQRRVRHCLYHQLAESGATAARTERTPARTARATRTPIALTHRESSYITRLPLRP